MEINSSFWKGKKVLITGHTGFKGAWLTMWLSQLGAKITGFSLEKYPNDVLFNKTGISKEISDQRGDISDFSRLQEVFRKSSPEIVFHLAAQPLVRESYKSPSLTINSNVMGTVNVLECIHQYPVKSAVMITSDKCYEDQSKSDGYNETDRIGGIDPYSCSKACCELVINSWRSSFNMPLASARAGNVIGALDWSEDRLVPDCITALKQGKEIKIRNPASNRPWQHVLEPLSGYLLLAQKLFDNSMFASAFNFGPNKDSIIPVSRLVNLIINAYGSGKWINETPKENFKETELLSLDISKAVSKLGWKPKLSIEDAVKLTVEGYKSNNIKETCINQIHEYEN